MSMRLTGRVRQGTFTLQVTKVFTFIAARTIDA
jgi:hypothetical protein